MKNIFQCGNLYQIHALWACCIFSTEIAPPGIQVSSPSQHGLKLNRLSCAKWNIELPTKTPWATDRSSSISLIWYPFLSSLYSPSPRRSRGSHKKTLVDRPFFLPSLSFWHPFLSSVFTRSPRRSRKSHKNSVAEGSFFPLSHLIPIPLIFLHPVTEAKQISVEKALIRFVTS